ncbi:uncharacterized protein BO66DRAFT_389752 [Aspergillus aculeatinus CBS 121060]|uniref:Uncharacterized protein n=1 Tax=Aspergillus aculeatinus CBS 121060 TaxID=1448322 RepID=A0ACD1HH64_9EURO|nr:hypothetical protein BO66DRAFT_389752 [Aspergillus aculeatinus CBS 121060]RAH72780.1 hypothetical protein BO66DRAFT_389752 [Aspergillus aculeatinus CBS 121060]
MYPPTHILIQPPKANHTTQCCTSRHTQTGRPELRSSKRKTTLVYSTYTFAAKGLKSNQIKSR